MVSHAFAHAPRFWGDRTCRQTHTFHYFRNFLTFQLIPLHQKPGGGQISNPVHDQHLQHRSFYRVEMASSTLWFWKIERSPRFDWAALFLRLWWERAYEIKQSYSRSLKKEKKEVDFFEYLDCMNGLAFFVIRGLFLESVSTFLFSLWPIWQPTKNVRVSFKLP